MRDREKNLEERGRENQAKGTAEKWKGRAKDAAGSAVGNHELEREGKEDRFEGKTREEIGKRQRELAGDRKPQ